MTGDLRATAREFARTKVAPLVAEMDRAAAYPPTLVKELFEAGLMGIEVPTSYGGLGGQLVDVIAAIEELSQVDPAVGVLVDVQNALVTSVLLRHGSGDQRRRFLPRLTANAVGAFAISETGAGSDAFAMSTTATRDGADYLLDGAKAWTTNAAEAGLFLIFARTGAALTAFLVERGTPGLSIGPRHDKLGIRASSTCDLTLTGVRVPAANVLGRQDAGGELAVEALNIGKLGIAAQLVGLAQGALDVAVAHARSRTQFGRRIAEFQGVRFPLARLAAELAAARALLYQTVEDLPGMSAVARLRATAMAKLVASDVAESAASTAVETLGGIGFTSQRPAEKLYRDAKIGKIYEGTSNIQLRTISATLFSEGS
ncbi:acyl-CoA dehydrogenase family protein [Micromonospora echinofusca]|uniref:acyl-CoA dehydrogenase family protein n=1 Tax=Micromonospora echinofusca TaxID=47858 RepID=UPI0027DE3756|nr:acyl-CoA dehydrogenase family protein [Micromonospora echinofusca]